MSIFGRKRKDESNLKDLIDALNKDALNKINNTMEKSPRDQESKKGGNEDDKNPKLNIFCIVKEYWFIISLLTFVYAIYTYIVIYYPVFDYNMPVTIEYIQEQIANGFYKWIFHTVLIVGVQAVSFILPLAAIYNLIKLVERYEKYLPFILICIWIIYFLFMGGRTVYYLTMIIIFPKKISKEIGGIYEIFMDDPCGYSLWGAVTIGSLLCIMCCGICRRGGVQASYNNNLSNNFLFKIFIVVIPFLLFVTFPLWSPMYRPVFLNGGSSVSCISGNNGEEPVDAIPYKYEARGVYVFRGEIKTDGGGREYLHDVNREFLFFEKGYKVTSGACKISSVAILHIPAAAKTSSAAK